MSIRSRSRARGAALAAGAALCLLAVSCATVEKRAFVATAYCGCGECCGWHRGSWKYLKLDFWNRYVSAGPRKGEPYTGRTASGTYPRTPNPGLFSIDSLTHPHRLVGRLLLFPWYLVPHKGTIAADTDYYPFGTVMYVPGWGWGVVEDRGGAIKGPDRIDLFFRFHSQTIRWGRQSVELEIRR